MKDFYYPNRVPCSKDRICLDQVLSTSETLPESMVQEAFDVFDVDGDGQISLSELRVMLSGQGKGCHDDTLVFRQ